MANSSPPWIRASEFVVTINNEPTATPGNTDTFKTGQKTVTSAGTPVQLSTVSVAVPAGKKVTVIAKPDNTGTIYFANTQALCVAGTYFNGLAAGLAHSFEVNNVNQIWIDASVNGEGVSWYCEQ